jgi:hypothetical protein
MTFSCLKFFMHFRVLVSVDANVLVVRAPGPFTEPFKNLKLEPIQISGSVTEVGSNTSSSKFVTLITCDNNWFVSRDHVA